ncbi:hypothetical protein A0H81_04623 [Grifola frondosa]|uniref:Uncharacterized protein n=1 Tax=Grifola frondosa TaxID=5627 RepID=A0A1C7MFK3_GRIFR|nr:hypothetical protein A0H81_04623 [Grifola frondosa]
MMGFEERLGSDTCFHGEYCIDSSGGSRNCRHAVKLLRIITATVQSTDSHIYSKSIRNLGICNYRVSRYMSSLRLQTEI